MTRPGKTVVIVLLVCCAAVFIAIVWTAIATDDDDSSSAPRGEDPRIGDHWHAAIGVNVCGEWLPPAPQFEQRAKQVGVSAGIHSHGDALIHLHPFASDEANDPTVGRFMDYGGWKLSSGAFTVWDSETHGTGQACATGGARPGPWGVGEEGEARAPQARAGGPGGHPPQNRDTLALFFP